MDVVSFFLHLVAMYMYYCCFSISYSIIPLTVFLCASKNLVFHCHNSSSTACSLNPWGTQQERRESSTSFIKRTTQHLTGVCVCVCDISHPCLSRDKVQISTCILCSCTSLCRLASCCLTRQCKGRYACKERALLCHANAMQSKQIRSSTFHQALASWQAWPSSLLLFLVL